MRIVTGFFVLSSLLVVNIAGAQDYQLDATYGEKSLASGFLPDPFTVDLDAGGSIDSARLGADCIGLIADAPDFELTLEDGGFELYLYVLSIGDTSLVVNTPSGDWLCDDDSAGNLNPLLELTKAESGIYDIWVGNVDTDEKGDYVSATLMISELEP
ncbi:peptidase S1 [Gammaproteobacteria bacterium]|nr:peptidase S1 [Gammaproteobacteria bacterium]